MFIFRLATRRLATRRLATRRLATCRLATRRLATRRLATRRLAYYTNSRNCNLLYIICKRILEYCNIACNRTPDFNIVSQKF